MLIGELSIKTGFSRDTIRFYEKRGLLSVGRKERRDNNYKEYSQALLKRLLMIKELKKFGFTLNEIDEFLRLAEIERASCPTVSKKMRDKIQWVDRKIQELKELRKTLMDVSDNKPSTCTPCVEDKNCPTIVSDFQ